MTRPGISSLLLLACWMLRPILLCFIAQGANPGRFCCEVSPGAMAFIPIPMPRDQTLIKHKARANECSYSKISSHPKGVVILFCQHLALARHETTSLGTKASFHSNCTLYTFMSTKLYQYQSHHPKRNKTQFMQRSK